MTGVIMWVGLITTLFGIITLCLVFGYALLRVLCPDIYFAKLIHRHYRLLIKFLINFLTSNIKAEDMDSSRHND